MAHEVFISHSSKDKAVADATCAFLENRGIRCWVAPRDIRPGDEWGSSIVKAIRGSKVMILIFSSHANASPQIRREVERAVNAGATIIPMRIENVLPQDSLDYFLGTPHWLDAFSGPLEHHLERLSSAIHEILEIPAPAVPVAPLETEVESADAVFTATEPEMEQATELEEPPVSRISQAKPTAFRPAPLQRAVVPPSISSPEPQTPKLSGKGCLIGLAAALLMGGLFCYFFIVAPSKEQTKMVSEAVVDGRIAAEAAAAKQNPKSFENSLGMLFVPAGTDGVLFSIWDVRVKDYQAFVTATGHGWAKLSFSQTVNDPAVDVSWDDAEAFCQWLTKKEKAEGKLGPNQNYRLPMDAEWSKAVGLGDEGNGIPSDKSGKITGVYPWGTQWPPPSGAGNYDESLTHDGCAFTSPVGSFTANSYGLYDMGGNVWQWCEDKYDPAQGGPVLRGAAWENLRPVDLLSSARNSAAAYFRSGSIGFRCVLVTGSPTPSASNLPLSNPPL